MRPDELNAAQTPRCVTVDAMLQAPIAYPTAQLSVGASAANPKQGPAAALRSRAEHLVCTLSGTAVLLICQGKKRKTFSVLAVQPAAQPFGEQ